MVTRKTTAKPARKKTEIIAEPVSTRRRVGADMSAPSSYFVDAEQKTELEFFSTGASTLDQALGGGFVLGRVSNIVGDRSVGKTLLAMEAGTNFLAQYAEEDPWWRYGEAEAAWDSAYARALGAPVDKIILNKDGRAIETVEELYEDANRCLDLYRGRPGLYALDSLDALSSAAEMEEDFDKASFGGAKPKAIGKLFRMLVDRFAEQRVHLMIVSQLRDKIGVTFGETKTRSGGNALDYYASHILWLQELGKLKQTIRGIERTTGVNVQGYVKKNKVGLPFRKVEYPVLYGYGIDDLTSSAEWLIKHNREALLTKQTELTKANYKTELRKVRDGGGSQAKELRNLLGALVAKEWAAVETDFLPKSSKY